MLVLLGVLALVHGLLLLSGDPASALLPIDADPATKEALRHKYGLDDAFPVQFVKFVGRAARGDFGDSYRQARPALHLVMERLPATLQLGGVGLFLALFIGLPLGAIAALRKGTIVDRFARGVAAVSQAVPGFWLGLVVLIVFGVHLHWLPISGRGDWTHLVMPGIVIALPTIPAIVRLFRSTLIGVLERDYVRTARAKGLSTRRILGAHVLRNASIPVLTIIGFEIGSILSGALIAEVIFAYPGMGRLAYDAIVHRDLAVVQVYVVLVSILVLGVNLLLDLSYGLLDPRIRVQ